MNVRRRPAVPLLLAAMMLAGCSVYDGRYAFEPPIVSVGVLDDEAVETESVRTLVSVIGVRRNDPDTGLPASVEIRVRVENDGAAPVRLEPTTLSLVAANLRAFPEPIVTDPGPVHVASGEHAIVNAYFPIERVNGTRAVDLSGLNLHWALDIGDRRVTGSSDFKRRRIDYPAHRFSYRYGYSSSFDWYRRCWW